MVRGLLQVVSLLMVAVCISSKFQLENGGKKWALLVAGSNGYDNYRHQADVCHAYQILHKNGIPDENIIVMMYDDIANNSMNPTPGIIINHPNGSDVYKGVLKDYTGDDVNPKNFLNVLTGNAKAMKGIGSGRVLKSGPKDHVFVNFVDHGAPGILAFPQEELYAKDLEKALMQMAHSRKFGRLVFYVEACESGSMFDKILPEDLEIFAVTAANPSESSYACYYDDERRAYLGDVFSVVWMEDSDEEILTIETLQQQFELVRERTNTSHVQEYGELDMGPMHVSEFLGSRPSEPKSARFYTEKSSPGMDAVPSQHVPVAVLERKIEATDDPKEKRNLEHQLHIMLKLRQHMENVTDDILLVATGKNRRRVQELKTNKYSLKLEDFDCYKKLVKSYSENCFKLSDNPYGYRQLHKLASVCGHDKVNEDSVLKAIIKVCSTHPYMQNIV